MNKAILSSISLCLCLLSAQTHFLFAQELPARQSFGISTSFAPDSSHILIGIAQQRRVWTISGEYGRTFFANDSIRLDYEGSITPFFQERDPTIQGTTFVSGGTTVITPTPNLRVIRVTRGPAGVIYYDGAPPVFYYDYGFGSEKTYGLGVSPLGARINGFNRHRLQPTFSLDLGLVLSQRGLPIDGAAQVNYLFSIGPGIEFYYQPNRAIRLEYLYRHMSTFDPSLNTNPGVDAGVFRVTLTRRHH